MPALNFNEVFAARVMSGEICQIIQPFRKDGCDPRVDDTLYLFGPAHDNAGTNRELLALTTCLSRRLVAIDEDENVFVETVAGSLTKEALTEFAKKEGFESTESFLTFFRETHGIPFVGLLIEWGGLR